MEKGTKFRLVKAVALTWLVLAGCKFPDFLSGAGEAIGKMFSSMWRGFGF